LANAEVPEQALELAGFTLGEHTKASFAPGPEATERDSARDLIEDSPITAVDGGLPVLKIEGLEIAILNQDFSHPDQDGLETALDPGPSDGQFDWFELSGRPVEVVALCVLL